MGLYNSINIYFQSTRLKWLWDNLISFASYDSGLYQKFSGTVNVRDVPTPGGAGRARPALLLAAWYKTKKLQVPPGRNFY